MKIYYRDFMTNKQHWTGGKFIKWQRGGPMGAFRAVVERRCSVLFIPHYLIDKDSIAQLPPLPAE